MIPCLYASMEKKFDNNGIGKMADAHSCVVTEKRNGSFELEMVYPAHGKMSWKTARPVHSMSFTARVV